MSFPFSVPRKTAYTRYMDDMVFGMSGRIPGKTHYVRPTTDYASYDADAWTKNHNHNVYDTVALALAACVSGRGDAIVLAPGTHTVATASLAMAKAGVKIWGPEAWMGTSMRTPSAILTTSVTGDEIANVTAPDCGIFGVTVRPITASDAIDLSAAATGFTVDGCYFDLHTPAASTSTIGVTAAAAAGFVCRNSFFLSDGAQGPGIVATGMIDGLIEKNWFVVNAGSWGAAILCGAATSGLIDNNHFICRGTAMTVGIDGTGATLTGGVQVTRNVNSVLVTKLVDNFDSGEAELGINYIMTVGGGTGGTLVTATT